MADVAGFEALRALSFLMATDSRDWSADRGDARLYAVVQGWSRKSLDELAVKHGWTKQQVRAIRAQRADYVRLCLSLGLKP